MDVRNKNTAQSFLNNKMQNFRSSKFTNRTVSGMSYCSIRLLGMGYRSESKIPCNLKISFIIF